MNKPEITQLSQSHGFLVLALCLISMEIGTFLGEGPPKSYGAILNFMVAGMLLINCLAFQFKWSQSATVYLRGAAWAWIIAVFAAVIFYR